MAVYLKGCPLSCQWCHSPESRLPEPELIYMEDRCALCGTCATVCPHEVHKVNGSHEIDWNSCQVCDQCVDNCPSDALQIKGYHVSADRIISKARRLKPFFDRPNGGLTLTRGEVIRQPEFASEILRGCREHGIHTAIETCGA